MSASSNRAAAVADLNREEARLAALLAEGHTSEAMAEELGITTAQLHHRLDALSRKLTESSKGR